MNLVLSHDGYDIANAAASADEIYGHADLPLLSGDGVEHHSGD
jgi:hypothetical protein